jgi:hypothetical protein
VVPNPQCGDHARGLSRRSPSRNLQRTAARLVTSTSTCSATTVRA